MILISEKRWRGPPPDDNRQIHRQNAWTGKIGVGQRLAIGGSPSFSAPN